MIMFERIRYHLKPPIFHDEEQNRIANLLQISLLTLIIGTVIGLFNCLLFSYFETGLALTIGLVGVIGSFLLLRYHHLTAASWTMLLTLIITLMLLILIGEGSHDIAILLFPVVIMVAGLLLDKRPLVVFTMIVILSLQGIILGEATGIIVNKMSEFTLIADMVAVTAILFISAMTTFLLSDSIRRAFRGVYQNEQTLREGNRKLHNEIHERSRIEASLRESEKKYRTLAETMTDALFTLDIKGNFTYLTPTFERIMGYRVRDFLGRSFTEIIAPEYIRPTVEMFKQGISGKRTPLYQIELICKNGERLPIELNMSTILDAKGQAIGRLGIARDITERKKSEDALRESE